MVQINSFCGGSSKLVDSEFLGMEESLNMYPETVTATDTYTTKMLKGVEGFDVGFSFEGEYFCGVGVVSSNPGAAVTESLLVISGVNGTNIKNVYNIYGTTKSQVGTFEKAGQRCIIEETPNGIALALLYNQALFAVNPAASPAVTCSEVTLPDAFDHAGKIKPTQMAQINFRVVLNDNNSDYIYWSELNRPTNASDTHAFEQYLTQYAYEKLDGTEVTFSDNVFYAPAEGSYVPGSLTTQETYTSSLNSMKMDFKADNVVALRATDTSLFVFGKSSLEILRWQNSTVAPFAIVYKTSACGVAWDEGVTVIGNECVYVGRGPGNMMGVFAVDENGNVRKLSTNAIDQRLSHFKHSAGTDFDYIRVFGYAWKGHQFIIASIKEKGGSGEETLCYDMTEGEWSDRASFDENGNRHEWCAKYSVSLEGTPYFVTESASGLVRVTRFNKNSNSDRYLDDNDLVAPVHNIVRSRTTGIKYDGVNDIIVTGLELIMNAGATEVVNPAKEGYDPKLVLQVSVDGGRTWSDELWANAGRLGEYSWRVRWNALGRGARFAFRVKFTDPVPFEIATAYLSYIPCGNRI